MNPHRHGRRWFTLVVVTTLSVVFGWDALVRGRAEAGLNQWSTNGPGGGSVLALAVNPSAPGIVYAAMGTGGVFKTTDGGDSWARASNGLTGQNVRSLAIDGTGTTLYAGTATTSQSLFKSTDSGASWAPTNPFMLGNAFDIRVVVSPTTAAIYAGGLGGTGAGLGGLFKSTNGGTSWTAITTGLTDTRILSLVVDPSDPNTLYVGTFNGGVFRSTNAGSNWTAMNLGLPINPIDALAIDPQAPATIYAGTDAQGVFKSTNSGGNWAPAINGLTDLHIRALVIAPTGIVYAGTSTGGVFTSFDAGGSWTPANVGLTDMTIQALIVAPGIQTLLYAGTGALGVFKNPGAQSAAFPWTLASTKLSATFVQAVAIDRTTPTTLYAGTAAQGLFKSTDAGGTWTAMNNGLTNLRVKTVAIDPSNTSTLYAGTGGGVFKSTNGGANWTPMNAGLAGDLGVHSVVIDPLTPTTLYAGTITFVPNISCCFARIFKSTNGGGMWVQSDAGFIGGGKTAIALAINPQTPTTVFAGVPLGFHSEPGGVFKSTNGGLSWQQVFPTAVLALAIDPVTPTTMYAGGSGVFKSIDGGSSWTTMNTGLSGPGFAALAIDPVTPTRVYAGSSNFGAPNPPATGVFKTTDGAANWFAFNAGLTNTNVNALAIDPLSPATVYAGTGGGVFDITQNPLTARDFDGDGLSDVGIFRRSTGQWFVALSGTPGGSIATTWGAPASSGLGDTPVPHDYDGDGKADLAVYRQATGEWFVFGTATGFRTLLFGAPAASGLGDIPVPGDYDGDGKADLAVYRRATGEWFIFGSASGFRTLSWGAPAASALGDIPVPADYDGDGKDDVAVYRSSSAQWFVALSGTPGGSTVTSFGLAPNDVPVPGGDYDGDGRADLVVFRPSTGEWLIRRSSDGGVTSFGWGAPASSGLGDTPLP